MWFLGSKVQMGQGIGRWMTHIGSLVMSLHFVCLLHWRQQCFQAQCYHLHWPVCRETPFFGGRERRLWCALGAAGPRLPTGAVQQVPPALQWVLLEQWSKTSAERKTQPPKLVISPNSCQWKGIWGSQAPEASFKGGCSSITLSIGRCGSNR